MKKAILTMLAAIVAAASLAQTSLLATLNHEGTITSYYGVNALKDAYKDAADGDIITLSSGQFNSYTINKSITVRGAGINADAESQRLPTTIINDFQVNSTNVTFESVIINGKALLSSKSETTFNKCLVSTIKDYYAGGSSTKHTDFKVTVLQSLVKNSFVITDKCSATLINSCFNSITSSNSETGIIQADNCIILDNPTCKKGLFNNCLIDFKTGTFEGSNNAFNCIAIGSSSADCWSASETASANQVVPGYAMFKSFDGSTWDERTNFELTTEAAAAYLGKDDKQVGLYGGTLPFDIVPNTPRITKMNVADKSTVDGKLSVDITVAMPK